MCAIGCGTVGGVLFGFSAFIMKALARLPYEQGVAAMQSINIVAVTPPFMAALFGTALGCLILAVVSFGQGEATGPLLAGSALYLVGVIGLTIVYHVPRNNALARVDPAEAAAQWKDYVARWTAWNHVRTATGVSAAAAFIVALR